MSSYVGSSSYLYVQEKIGKLRSPDMKKSPYVGKENYSKNTYEYLFRV